MPDFKAAIETAKQRAQIRKHNVEESDSLSTASDGKLKRQKDWLVWSRSLTNYLSTILGQDGVPLSYVKLMNQTMTKKTKKTSTSSSSQSNVPHWLEYSTRQMRARGIN
jgi:hypothetical protein